MVVEAAGRRRKMGAEGGREGGRQEEEDVCATILISAHLSRMRVAFCLVYTHITQDVCHT